MGPEHHNPLSKKITKVDKRQRLAELRGEASQETGSEHSTYKIVRGGSELQRKLADRLDRAVLEREQLLEVGEAEPTGDQIEIVPETKVDEKFLQSLPGQRSFVIYANSYDLAKPAEKLQESLGSNVMIVFESTARLIDELNSGAEKS